jgi:hypothetical protein
MVRPSSAPFAAPRESGPVAHHAVAALAPEPPRARRPRLQELIAKAESSGPVVAASPELDEHVDLERALARARVLAGGDMDVELANLRESAAAPIEISVEEASAELARQLGGHAIARRDRSARWAPPPASVPTTLLARGTDPENPVVEVPEPVDARGDEPVDARGVEPVDAREVEPIDVRAVAAVEPIDARGDEPVDARAVAAVEPVDARGVEPVDAREDEPVDARGDEPVGARAVDPAETAPVEPVDVLSDEDDAFGAAAPGTSTAIDPAALASEQHAHRPFAPASVDEIATTPGDDPEEPARPRSATRPPAMLVDDDDEIEELDSMDLVPDEEMPSESTQIGAMPVDPNAFQHHGQPTVPDPLAEQLDAHLAAAEAEADAELAGEMRAASQSGYEHAYAEQPYDAQQRYEQQPYGEQPDGQQRYEQQPYSEHPTGEQHAYGEDPVGDQQAYAQQLYDAGHEPQPYAAQPGYEQPSYDAAHEQPYGDQPPYAEQPYGEQQSHDARPAHEQPYGAPYAEQPYGEQQSHDAQPAHEQPYGDPPPYAEQPYGEPQAYAEQPYNAQPGYEPQPYAEQPYNAQPGYEPQAYAEQSSNQDAYAEQPYNEQAYGEQPPYEQQPYGDPQAYAQPYNEPAYAEQPQHGQAYGEPDEAQEEISDFDVLAEADADDADLLSAHGEQEASGGTQAAPADEGSFDFASRAQPGEGSFDYAAQRPASGEGSFDYASRLDLGDDSAEHEFSSDAERGYRGGVDMRRARSYGNGYDDGPPAYQDARRQPSYAEERPDYDSFDSPSSYTIAESAPVRATPFGDDPYGVPAPIAEPSVLRDNVPDDLDLETALEALDVDLDELGAAPDRSKPALPGLPAPRTPTGQVPTRTPTGQAPTRTPTGQVPTGARPPRTPTGQVPTGAMPPRTPTGQVPLRATGGSRTVPPPLPTPDPETARASARARRVETPIKPKRAATEDDGVLIDFDDDD